MNLKVIIAAALAFGIGFGCRWFKVPVPAPPTLTGVLLVVAITLGYISAAALKGEAVVPQAPAAGSGPAAAPGGMGEGTGS